MRVPSQRSAGKSSDSKRGVRAAQLRIDELLSYRHTGGIIRFAGERALLLDAVALGLLRKQLIESFGLLAARAILTQFGYSHGWRTADTLEHAVEWQSAREWRIAGGRLHRLQGMVTFEPVDPSARTGPEPFADAIWKDSYEAEQHVLHLGRAAEPVCWTLVGFASGYLSRVTGQPIYCIEESCCGSGDATCRMVGKSQDDWGREIDAHLPFYKSDCLQSDLRAVRQALRKAEAKLRRVSAAATGIGELQGEEEAGLLYISAKMRELVQQARRVAASDATVLIRGESGVGKEGLARLLHHRSPRAAGPLLSVNCAAVPEGLLESELFGHVKGAFTGAVSERVGLFESARGGTLLLDEIGDVSPAMQAKLLRVLQEREVRRVGETKTRSIDVRILAATHRDLEAEVAAGRFRQDLYYRLRVIELLVPPLRERIEEVVPLAVRFLAEHAHHSGQPAAVLSPEARRALLSYSWPGNVRELSNAIERAAVLAGGARIEVGDLPVELQRESSTAPSKAAAAAYPALTLAEAERRHILGTLAAALGNRARAAQVLGIGQATLFRKLKQYGVTAG